MKSDKTTLIGTDIDDSILDNLAQVIAWHNRNYGTSLTKADFTGSYYSSSFRCTVEEAWKRMGEYARSDYYCSVAPIPGAVQGLGTFSELPNTEIIAITARSRMSETRTAQTINEHFSNYIGRVVHARTQEDEWLPKGPICKELGLALMIEDALEVAENIADEAGIPVFLLEQPWNKGKIPKNELIIPVKTWEELVVYGLAALS